MLGSASTDDSQTSLVTSDKTNTDSSSIQKVDLLNQYLAEIRRYPLLSPEEEKELAVRYYEEQDQEAGRRLITSNLRLVVKMAFKYHSQWSNVLDLIQQGNIGLLQALKKYDPFNATKTRFSSYAAYWIRSCIYNYIKDNYRIVRLGSTRHGRKLFDNLRKERERLQQMGIQPSTKALSESLDIPEEEIIIFAQHFSNPTLSLESPSYADDKRAIGETIPSNQFESPEETATKRQIGNRVKDQLELFTETLRDDRERAIWEQRLFTESPKSLKELGEAFGVSKERVRQIESKLKIRLRVFLEENLGDDLELDFSLSPEA
ncbi:MAG: sigma-70 family RNA polymerase sigma factor [Myxococcota bacterium]|nr:sigma-70 family RNA polymerase sigma factor [Myxococcota bacterium]